MQCSYERSKNYFGNMYLSLQERRHHNNLAAINETITPTLMKDAKHPDNLTIGYIKFL